jgi:hypothetical protein
VAAVPGTNKPRDLNRYLGTQYRPTNNNNNNTWVPCHHGMARPQVVDVTWVPCHHDMARPQVADVTWIPCHHGMARPRVADGGDGLQIWRVADILNKQSRTADKGWASSLGVGYGDNNSSSP